MEKEDKGKQTSSKAEDDELDTLMELISGEFIFQNDQDLFKISIQFFPIVFF